MPALEHAGLHRQKDELTNVLVASVGADFLEKPADDNRFAFEQLQKVAAVVEQDPRHVNFLVPSLGVLMRRQQLVPRGEASAKTSMVPTEF